MLFDPTTNRLFCGRDIFDGTTLATLGHLHNIDRIIHADQGLILAQRSSRDGTASAVQLESTALTAVSRMPLVRQATTAGTLSYDPASQRLYLSDPHRGRVLSWLYTQ